MLHNHLGQSRILVEDPGNLLQFLAVAVFTLVKRGKRADFLELDASSAPLFCLSLDFSVIYSQVYQKGMTEKGSKMRPYLFCFQLFTNFRTRTS